MASGVAPAAAATAVEEGPALLLAMLSYWCSPRLAFAALKPSPRLLQDGLKYAPLCDAAANQQACSMRTPIDEVN